jgi:CheY-like chemotaxis protein/HD-like signal output (HDOD) protein
VDRSQQPDPAEMRVNPSTRPSAENPMGKILIVDDTQFWRDIAANALQAKGHEVFTASDGIKGLAMLSSSNPDLLILDVEMPAMPGLAFLEQIRRYAKWKQLPVIMLTGDMFKEHILRAKQLGAVEYLLKSNFSIDELLGRVQRRLSGAAVDPVPPAPAREPLAQPQAVTPPRLATTAVAPKPQSQPPGDAPIPRLMDRDTCIERAKAAMQARTLPGAIAQVMSVAASPRAELSDISSLIVRDPGLSARILHIANTPAYASRRGVVSNIPDAVRNIGRSAVRDIAGAMGVFDAMPTSEADGFNPIRTWQHSFAVANLCAQLVGSDDDGTGYLIGLCHDLGEILFRTQFGPEYQQVLQCLGESGMPLVTLEKEMLGVTRGELVQIILQCLGLPEAIHKPIASFHEAPITRAPTHPLAKILQLADLYATGMQLAASEHSVIRPASRIECRNATTSEDPQCPDAALLRSEVFTLTAMLGRASLGDSTKMLEPMYRHRDKRILLIRDPSLSGFDPIAAAMESLCNVTVCTSFSADIQRDDHDALMVLADKTCEVDAFSARIQKASAKPAQVLWLTAKRDEAQLPQTDSIEATTWPIALASLARFVEAL